jgi:DNA repair exonuclease SbcCD ATPase subunit
MASESTDEAGLTVSLPAAVDEWLDAKAEELGVDRETVVVQLLAAYRAAGELDDDRVAASLTDGVEDRVRDVVAERLPDIADAVEEQTDTGDDAERVEDRLSAELDRVENDFQESLQDVRERIVQVKRETDRKAPEDHAHPEFDELGAVSNEVDDLFDRIDDLSEATSASQNRHEDLEARVADLEDAAERVDDIEEKLQTVAWVVSDVREAVEADAEESRAIDRLKQSAAEADVDRAVCDNCEQSVDIALLSEPNCPHCETTFGDVELPGGLFGKPRLSVAKQLEAGADADSDYDVPDAAQRDT